jgi:hypothetical protein
MFLILNNAELVHFQLGLEAGMGTQVDVAEATQHRSVRWSGALSFIVPSRRTRCGRARRQKSTTYALSFRHFAVYGSTNKYSPVIMSKASGASGT